MKPVDYGEREIESKRSLVLGRKRPRTTVYLVSIGVVLLLAVGLYLMSNRPSPSPAVATPSTATSGEIRYPVSEFADGQARFYRYRAPEGLEIRYFVIRSSDGVIRAAFDACDSCWTAGKGYRQQGDLLVCNNCGLSFSSNRVNEVRGGCNPSPLTRGIEGDEVVISTRDLVEEGARYFDFRGREG